MREILFRGKTDIGNQWIYGNLIQSDECLQIVRANKAKFAVIPLTVGQFTGLLDKNGKRIFEGDIVNDKQSGYNYYIKWFPDYACFSLANKNGHMEFGCDEIEIFLNDLVVVGNVHDNHEFLKGE